MTPHGPQKLNLDSEESSVVKDGRSPRDGVKVAALSLSQRCKNSAHPVSELISHCTWQIIR